MSKGYTLRGSICLCENLAILSSVRLNRHVRWHTDGISVFVLRAIALVSKLCLKLAGSKYFSEQTFQAQVGKGRLKPPRNTVAKPYSIGIDSDMSLWKGRTKKASGRRRLGGDYAHSLVGVRLRYVVVDAGDE